MFGSPIAVSSLLAVVVIFVEIYYEFYRIHIVSMNTLFIKLSKMLNKHFGNISDMARAKNSIEL